MVDKDKQLVVQPQEKLQTYVKFQDVWLRMLRAALLMKRLRAAYHGYPPNHLGSRSAARSRGYRNAWNERFLKHQEQMRRQAAMEADKLPTL